MALLRMSLLKLVRRPATWVVLLILVGLILMVFLGLAASVGQIEDAGDELQIRVLLAFPTAYTTVVGFILGFGGLLAVVYAAAVIGADWAWGTIRAIVARGEGRVRYALITFLAIAIMLGLGVVITFVIGAVAAVVAAELAGLGSEGATDPETLAAIPELLGRTWLGVSRASRYRLRHRHAVPQPAGRHRRRPGLLLHRAVPGPGTARRRRPALLPLQRRRCGRGDLGWLGGGFAGLVPLDSDTALLWSAGYLVVALAIGCLTAWRAQITQ